MPSDTRMMLGSLRTEGGLGVLRLEERFPAGIDDVWSALTEPRRLARWYGDVQGELRPGGTFRAHVFASGWDGTGRVEACEPPRQFVVVSKDPDEPHEDSTDVTLTADGGETALVVEQRGLPLELLHGYAAGMQIHVEDLGDHLAGRGRRDAEPRFAALIPAYKRLRPIEM
ncbi:MAG TPA: SRPBCC family protein [Gaiellaceae bacterium]|nr:SRPBCC family protein [Gaiellaceae bacterium]